MSTKFTCRFCKEQFDQPKSLYKHLQLVHNAGASRDNKTCPICGVLCSKYESYRDHLLYIHGQTDEGQKLTFKSLNEFLVWKAELELKHNCKYVLQTSPKVLPTKEKKYFYQCDRSDSKSKDKKSVVMKTCSSVVSVVEGINVFKVEYWDTHSGHTDAYSAPPVQTQSELDAAISSVEMVNAIGDSDDSFDRSEELLTPENSNPPISNIDKQTFIKSNSTINSLNKSPIINAFQKTKILQSGKFDVAKKKTNNTSIFSLASVACGKGISKKSASKAKENKISDIQSNLKSVNLKSDTEKIKDNSADSSLKQREIAVPKDSINAKKMEESTTAATSSALTVMTKTTPSGPLAIAPKMTPVANNTVNPLFATNSTYQNQFVIMNPVGMDQNSLSSSPVLTPGQNILLSLGPVGQNIPPICTSQTSEEKKTASSNNTKVSVADTFLKVNKPNIFSTARKSFPNSQSASKSIINSMASTVTSNSITLTPGLNTAPVILSSLPVGSTFMSVNNNLIPIASPSGAFIPTSLPPNIVLTPVVPSASLPNVNSSNTTVNALSSTPQNIQTQVRFTTPSTVAITVSSIVKEPVYTSSAIKHMSNVTSSTSPVSSTNSLKNSRQRSQFVPITTAGRISPVKNENKSTTSPKGSSNANKCKNAPNSVANKAETSSNSSSKNVSKTFTSSPIISDSISSGKPSARKRMTRSTKSKSSASPVVTSSFSTKVVNSRLHLTPISSTPNVTVAPQLNGRPGTMLFESSAGDIYMLEPIENDENSTPSKIASSMEIPKIRIERSVQTNESSSMPTFSSNFQRKRAAPPTDDSAVMLKVKCYQLEMKYLNSQAECKRLKVELTKERLKNAEFSGKTTLINAEEESLVKKSNANAAEIMKEIEDRFSENKDVNIYTMTKTSVLRSLYEDLEELCTENSQLYKELDNYRAHDKFYKSLKKKLYDEEF